jgi:hypothetical protein
MDNGDYLFKWKIAGLQRLYGVYLGVKLYPPWTFEPNDDRPNDYREGDPMELWKGRNRDDDRNDYRRRDDDGPVW